MNVSIKSEEDGLKIKIFNLQRKECSYQNENTERSKGRRYRRVVKLHGEGAVKRRIMDMGLTKGVDVQIRKVAPLGDPIEVTVRGYELSIRKADAEMIETE